MMDEFGKVIIIAISVFIGTSLGLIAGFYSTRFFK